ncbi:hypothetical protein MAHJHV49_07020 [Mycobacterium avium subsp. hominissuis]|uniref:YggT family protein n=1 Tax=Mycobacterium avium TaxID=1764 RepID=UPI001CDADD10|nr:YggT family protein [Mycobacterium avium]MCA2293006.1 YggT family protein [Mycobacterium avium]
MKMTLILSSFINFLFGLIEGLLMVRVVLKLFGANAAAPFVHWTYGVTAPLLAPFQGAFPAPVLDGVFVIEFTALFAILVYALGAYLLQELVAYTDAWSTRRVVHK